MAKKKVKLTREMILASDDMKREEVPVPEWAEGATVTVTTWSAKTRDQFDFMVREEQQKGNGNKSARGIIVALSIIDPDTGDHMFNVDDIEALSKKNQAPINRIFQTASRLNPLYELPIKDTAKN